jgi:hypothetical protein
MCGSLGKRWRDVVWCGDHLLTMTLMVRVLAHPSADSLLQRR